MLACWFLRASVCTCMHACPFVHVDWCAYVRLSAHVYMRVSQCQRVEALAYLMLHTRAWTACVHVCVQCHLHTWVSVCVWVSVASGRGSECAWVWRPSCDLQAQVTPSHRESQMPTHASSSHWALLPISVSVCVCVCYKCPCLHACLHTHEHTDLETILRRRLRARMGSSACYPKHRQQENMQEKQGRLVPLPPHPGRICCSLVAFIVVFVARFQYRACLLQRSLSY